MTDTAARLAWDYTEVAEAYLKRPGYAANAIDAIVRHAALVPGACVADIGAGTGNLTLPLLERGLELTAVEPNDAMRRLGQQRTADRSVRWRCGWAAETGLADACCDGVGFGSSFNVVATSAALAESARILRPRGWLFCLWNHRRLDDGLQAAIEEVIRAYVPGFAPGSRRDDPSAALRQGSLFGEVQAFEAPIVHSISRADFAEAWLSHLTLRRQAGAALADVMAAIRRLLEERAPPMLQVPYTTRVWLARKRDR